MVERSTLRGTPCALPICTWALEQPTGLCHRLAPRRTARCLRSMARIHAAVRITDDRVRLRTHCDRRWIQPIDPRVADCRCRSGGQGSARPRHKALPGWATHLDRTGSAALALRSPAHTCRSPSFYSAWESATRCFENRSKTNPLCTAATI